MTQYAMTLVFSGEHEAPKVHGVFSDYQDGATLAAEMIK
jgi:hypothetical protein